MKILFCTNTLFIFYFYFLSKELFSLQFCSDDWPLVERIRLILCVFNAFSVYSASLVKLFYAYAHVYFVLNVFENELFTKGFRFLLNEYDTYDIEGTLGHKFYILLCVKQISWEFLLICNVYFCQLRHFAFLFIVLWFFL